MQTVKYLDLFTTKQGDPVLHFTFNSGNQHILHLNQVAVFYKHDDRQTYKSPPGDIEYQIYFDLDAQDGGYVIPFANKADRDKSFAAIIDTFYTIQKNVHFIP